MGFIFKFHVLILILDMNKYNNRTWNKIAAVTKSHVSLGSTELCRINGLKPVSPMSPGAKTVLTFEAPYPQLQVKITGKSFSPTILISICRILSFCQCFL